MITNQPRFSLTATMMAACLLSLSATAQTTPPDRWWSDAAEQALTKAGTNRDALVSALQEAPSAQREGMEFLVANMPTPDLRKLSGKFLLDHVTLVYESFAKAPWHDRIPHDIFLNDILPYACISETREAWGVTLRDLSVPLVTNVTSPGEAAQQINKQLFPLVKVKYSTARRKAIQSPSETMSTGLATCSGLSILLVDACRAVGVPARVVGVPMWVDNRGNHTWVEVWDGQWHFTGAAEYDPKGLDHSWFEHDASLELKDVPMHSIYASSFKKTGTNFPGGDWMVNVENVTDRYTASVAKPEVDLARLQVKVTDILGGKRVPAKVTVSGPTNYAVCFNGTSKNEQADMNDYLSFNVKQGEVYKITAEWDGKVVEKAFTVGTNHEAIAVMAVQEEAPKPKPAPDPNMARLQVKVLDHLGGKLAATKVSVTDIVNHAIHFEGMSKDDQTETNDYLTFEVPRGQTYAIHCELDGKVSGRNYTAPGTNNGARGGRGGGPQGPVIISLADSTIPWHPAQPAYVPPPIKTPLAKADADALQKEFTGYFTATAEQQAAWKFSSALEPLLLNNEPAVRQAAWEAYKAAPIHEAAKKDYDTNQVTFETYLSPYTVKTVGTRPANGWPLFIAMHGGGNTPKAVNDSQWKQMQIYYKDHPEVGGYKYVALRAPNDTWNGFYDVYVYPLIDNLIKQFTVFGDVDVNKVFIMGYSHGGYGAFAIGPKEPDLFAAIHASAGAPTDGETTGKTLRTTVFTVMVGELDKDYGRFDRDQKFRNEIHDYKEGRSDIYPVTVQFIPNNPHTGLPDRDKIVEMYPVVRNPVPHEISWAMTDKVITDFFWVRTDAPDKKEEIDATCRDNHITINTTHLSKGSVLLDSRLVDLTKPVVFECNGKAEEHRITPSLRTLAETMLRRGDPDLAFTAEFPLPITTE